MVEILFYIVFHFWPNSVGSDRIYIAVKEILQQYFYVHIPVKGLWTLKIDQKIQVAFLGCFTAGRRAE